MRKTLMVVLLTGAVCLAGLSPAWTQSTDLKAYNLKVYDTLAEYEELTGQTIEELNEAPMLRVKVAVGEIPGVEQRIPEEPLVIQPLEQIGQYGGSLKAIALNENQTSDAFSLREQHMLEFSYDLRTIIPNIAKDWALSDDYKTLTLYLRKGMKWSDGKPYTADDILFWYEDIILDDELTPVKPGNWSPGGQLVEITKVDDYTLQFQFAVSYPRAVDVLSAWGGDIPPKHYLKKWHIKYNPDADKLAKDEGYEHWWECFAFHNLVRGRQRDVNRPSVDPWVLEEIDSAGNRYLGRNAYYWKIDTAGNQLPYVDEEVILLVGDLEVLKLKVISGEVSYADVALNLTDYPLFKQNEEEGDYEALLYGAFTKTSLCGFAFNYTHKDPVLKKIFNDIRFRQAASLAINRDEINETVAYGRAVPYSCPTPPSTSFYEDWMGEYYVEYNPKEANQLLDEMGLEWDEDHEYRLRPDGERFHLIAEYSPYTPDIGQIVELVKEYWGKIGIEMTLKPEDTNFYFQRMRANEHDIGIWAIDGSEEMQARSFGAIRFRPPWHWPGISIGGPGWRKWYDTGGKEGEEPPAEIKKLFSLVEEWLATPIGTEEYMELGKEILTINVEGLYNIGTVGLAPRLSMVNVE